MTLTACLFALFCSLLLPLGAGVYLALRTKRAAPVLLGAACFTVFQLLTRIPLLQFVLPKWAGYVLFESAQPVWYLLLLSLSAGVFEECGRYLVMRLFLKTGGPVDAVSFGVGHGGIEAVALVGVSLAYLLFTGGYLAQTAESLFLAGAERLFAMCSSSSSLNSRSVSSSSSRMNSCLCESCKANPSKARLCGQHML